ncbi:hypothetical protein GALL_289760 [mine drainage metagenome]|uniref:Uncharacterized protein n=1 Tax=mine drainage metagenome TaxID=410659 RepID=A0A1J5RHT3_9ZZZZ
MPCGKQIQTGLTIGRHPGFQADIGHQAGQQQLIVVLILGDQDADGGLAGGQAENGPRRRRRERRQLCRRRRFERQFHPEHRSLAGLAAHADAAAHQLDELAGDGQAQAGALRGVPRLQLHERLKQPRLVFRADAGAGILHLDDQPRPLRRHYI